MKHDDIYISSPRPMFEGSQELRKGVQHLKLGGTTSGVIIDVTDSGIVFNGYYQSFTDADKFFSCVREPVEITWEELEKVKRNAVESRKTKRKSKKKTPEPSKIDNPTEEYLDSLPIVTINKKKYYLDSKLRQRRPADNPKDVFSY